MFVPAARGTPGVGIFVKWKVSFRDVWRDVHATSQGVDVQYMLHECGVTLWSLLAYFPANCNICRCVMAHALGRKTSGYSKPLAL